MSCSKTLTIVNVRETSDCKARTITSFSKCLRCKIQIHTTTATTTTVTILVRSGKLWDALERSGKLWEALERSWKLWEALGSDGKLRGALGNLATMFRVSRFAEGLSLACIPLKNH